MGSSCAGLAIPPAPRQQYGLKFRSLVGGQNRDCRFKSLPRDGGIIVGDLVPQGGEQSRERRGLCREQAPGSSQLLILTQRDSASQGPSFDVKFAHFKY